MSADTTALIEALTECKHWHERQDKVLSKSGRGDAGYHWFRFQHREEIERIDAALASVAPPAPARVKNLEWTTDADAHTWNCDAPSFGTNYRIIQIDSSLTQSPIRDEYELSRDCVSLDEFDTLDEAKTAAQEDYAALVRDCLVACADEVAG